MKITEDIRALAAEKPLEMLTEISDPVKMQLGVFAVVVLWKIININESTGASEILRNARHAVGAWILKRIAVQSVSYISALSAERE